MSSTEGNLLFRKHVQHLLNLNIQTIRRMWQRDEFPKPIMINNRCAWPSSVIDQWLKRFGGFSWVNIIKITL